MKKITKNPILITLIIFLALFLLGIFTGSFMVRDRLDHIVYGNKFLQIESEYVSTITAEKDNLSTITVHLKNPALENEGNIMFQILEGGQVIREVGFTGKNVGDPGDVKLKFASISDSAGKSYLVKIVVSQNEPKLSVFVDDNDNLGGWFYYRNKIGLNGFSRTVLSFVRILFTDKKFLVVWVGSLVSVTFVYVQVKDED